MKLRVLSDENKNKKNPTRDGWGLRPYVLSFCPCAWEQALAQVRSPVRSCSKTQPSRVEKPRFAKKPFFSVRNWYACLRSRLGFSRFLLIINSVHVFAQPVFLVFLSSSVKSHRDWWCGCRLSIGELAHQRKTCRHNIRDESLTLEERVFKVFINYSSFCTQ